VWRLRIEKPDLIELSIDTMVMDNDEAEKREGVQPTYKRKRISAVTNHLEEQDCGCNIPWWQETRQHGNYGRTYVIELGAVIRRPLR